MMAGMKYGKRHASWLINNHIQLETNWIRFWSAYLSCAKNDDIKVESANTAFEDLFDWHDYNWQHGMYVEHILPTGGRKRFLDALTKAGEKPWNQIMLDTELKKKDGTILYCKAHILYRQT